MAASTTALTGSPDSQHCRRKEDWTSPKEWTHPLWHWVWELTWCALCWALPGAWVKWWDSHSPWALWSGLCCERMRPSRWFCNQTFCSSYRSWWHSSLLQAETSNFIVSDYLEHAQTQHFAVRGLLQVNCLNEQLLFSQQCWICAHLDPLKAHRFSCLHLQHTSPGSVPQMGKSE